MQLFSTSFFFYMMGLSLANFIIITRISIHYWAANVLKFDLRKCGNHFSLCKMLSKRNVMESYENISLYYIETTIL